MYRQNNIDFKVTGSKYNVEVYNVKRKMLHDIRSYCVKGDQIYHKCLNKNTILLRYTTMEN